VTITANRNDADLKAGLFLRRHLEQNLGRVLQKRFRELPYANGVYIPTKPDLQPGTADLIQDIIEHVGRAEINADEAFDIPLADIAADEEKFPVVAVFSAYHYTWRQLQAAQRGTVALRDQKAFAAKRAIDERMNDIAAYGAPKHKLEGFLNNARVPLSNVSFNPYDPTTWTGGPDDLIAFFLDEITAIVDSTELMESPNMALVPVKLHEMLIKTRIPNTSTNVKKYILENSTYLNDIRPSVELKSERLEAKGVQAAGTNKDRMVVYPLSDQILERHVELTKPLPEEYKDAKYKIPMYACTSGTIINFPRSMAYIDFPKAG
jgi:hypothetical protein